MLGVIFDIDSMDEGEFVILFSAQRDNAYRWIRLLQIARRANSKGQILQSNGAPISARFLAAMHRDPDGVEGMEAFLATALEVGLLVIEDGIYRIVDWTRWHKPKSQQAEASADRQAEKRASDRLRAENDKLKAALEQALSPKTDLVTTTPVTPCHNMSQGSPSGHNMSQVVTSPPLDVTSVTTHTHTHTLTHTDLENAACSVLSRESNENQGLEGVQSRPALMVAGVKTISSTANRLVSIVQQRFPTFIPKIQEADTLVRDMLDLCKRKSQWDDFFSEADFELGLDLASRHAEALEHEGKGPHKLLAWIRELNTRKYLQAAHDWRKGNEKRHAKGKPPLPPPEPDLSELERRR